MRLLPALYGLLTFSVLLSVPSAFAAFQSAPSCFESEGGYYNFGEAVKLQNFQADKASYNAGEEAMLDFNILGNQKAPIVEGFTRFQVFYNDQAQGEQMIDEFFGEEQKGMIYLRKGDIYNSRIMWKMPSNAKPGEYTIKVYFLSDEVMNLAGLSFIPYGPPGVPAASSTFTVQNPAAAQHIYFDKEKTWLSGNAYKFSTFNPSLAPETDVSVTTDIVNEGSAKQAQVTMEIYEWDDVTGKAMSQYTVAKEVNLAENGKQQLTFNVGRLAAGAYEVRFMAESKEAKGLMKLRFAIPGEKARLIYAGLADYPLMAGKEYKAFICFSNSADRTTETVTGAAFELSQGGKTVFSDSFSQLEVTGAPAMVTAAFTPTETVSDARAVIKLFNKDNQLVDQATLDYDYSKFYPAGGEFGLALTPIEGGGVNYRVSYTDSNKIPLKGKLLVYLLGSDGSVIETVDGMPFAGEYSGTFAKAENGHKVIARELTHDLKEEDTVRAAPAKPSEPEAPEAGGGGFNWIIPAIVLIIVLAIIFVLVRRGKK